MIDNSQNDRWRSVAPASFSWVHWGHDHIAYHRGSGITHFLNFPSKRLITEILREPQDIRSVAHAFDSSEEDTDWNDRIDQLLAMLERLAQLGFIERL